MENVLVPFSIDLFLGVKLGSSPAQNPDIASIPGHSVHSGGRQVSPPIPIPFQLQYVEVLPVMKSRIDSLPAQDLQIVIGAELSFFLYLNGFEVLIDAIFMLLDGVVCVCVSIQFFICARLLNTFCVMFVSGRQTKSSDRGGKRQKLVDFNEVSV